MALSKTINSWGAGLASLLHLQPNQRTFFTFNGIYHFLPVHRISYIKNKYFNHVYTQAPRGSEAITNEPIRHIAYAQNPT